MPRRRSAIGVARLEKALERTALMRAPLRLVGDSSSDPQEFFP